MNDFVHLHVHTEYSLREGAVRIEDGIRQAVSFGMDALAMTDTNALYGAVRFYKAAKHAGIKPILGVQLTVGMDEDAAALMEAKPGGPPLDQAVLLARDYEGYQNLCRLVTLAHARSRMPFVAFSELGRHRGHLFALIGGGESVILRSFSNGAADAAARWLSQWAKVWPADALYVDVQDHALPQERKGLPSLVRWAREHNVPLVATNDVHYLGQEDAQTQRILAQIESGPGVRSLEGDHYHFAAGDEMSRRFAKLPEALHNTRVIADACNVELPLDRVLQPQYPTADGESADVVLRRATEAGVRQRYGTIVPDIAARLEYELSTIERMGFADYFLVVADFIRFAHRQGISTGPGRGSAAGSLVAYALRITDVDPIANHLLFERFLNPERVSWPDIDTDFEFERRNEVIQYVVERYGADRVAQIGTFGTLAARAAIRDAGRALGMDPGLVDRLARLIPSYPGVTLDKAREEVSGIGDLLRSNEHAARLWTEARGLEGLPRHTSTHAAGVVISPIPLTDIVPLQPGSDGTPVTQYAMEDIENLGLIKMDFLGLRTLTLIDHCASSLADREQIRVDWRRVPLDDPATYAMLAKGETEGCFQLESNGMRRVLRDLKPTSFEDLVAVISLYRPGPMENIPVFIAAKHGKKPVQYPHPNLEPILRTTHGVIVYQEQIMQIASMMAGFSLGQSDLLRRAVSKKKREVLDAERSRFVSGCLTNGYDATTANHVYDLIVRFADYGYNRSHAAAYAVLAFRTAYLRAHHLPHFLASLMTMVMGDATKLKEYARDAKTHGIALLPAHVNLSQPGFVVEDRNSIRTGLLSVRNVGKGAVEAILEARREGPYTSLVDFVQRVVGRACNRKAVESLLEAGALADFLPDRASPEVAQQILEEALASVVSDRSPGLGLLFGQDGSRQPSGRAASGRRTEDSGLEVLFIRYDASKHGADVLLHIKSTLQRQAGELRVALFDESRRKVRLLQTSFSVTLTPELISMLEELVGIGNVRTGTMPIRR